MSNYFGDVHLVLPSFEELKRAQELLELEMCSSESEGEPEVVDANIRKRNVPRIEPTEEELKYRKREFSGIAVQKEKICCTACAKNLKYSVSLKQSITVHPTLSVLVCKACATFYGDGAFPVDEDGSDLYCRWCGEGGFLFLCSSCSCAFCRPCIKRNFARSLLREVDKDDWKCFICNPKPLWDLRAICSAVEEFCNKRSLSNRTKHEQTFKKKGVVASLQK